MHAPKSRKNNIKRQQPTTLAKVTTSTPRPKGKWFSGGLKSMLATANTAAALILP